MTRKDYELVAQAISRTTEHDPQDEHTAEGWHAATSAVAHRLADALASDNPRFNRVRFLRACNMHATV
jgi:hypothetical protein